MSGIALPQVVATAADNRAHVACIRFAHEAARGDYYKALGAARELIAFETAAAVSDADAA